MSLLRKCLRPFCLEPVFLGVGIGQIIPQALSSKQGQTDVPFPGVNGNANPFDLFVIHFRGTHKFSLFFSVATLPALR